MGVILALTAALGSALFLIGLKIMSRKGSNSLAMTSFYQIIAGIVVAFGILFEKPLFEWNFVSITMVILACIIWIGSSSLRMASNKYLDASLSVILMQFSLVVSSLGAVVLFHDQVTPGRIIGISFIILGNIILFLRKDVFKAKMSLKGIVLSLSSTILFGLAILSDKYNLGHVSINIYSTITFLVPAIVVAFSTRLSPQQFWQEFNKVKIATIFTGIMAAIGYYALLKSFNYIDTSVAAAINSLNTIFVVIIGIFFLKERQDLWRKLLAVVVVFAGALILNFA